MLLVSTEPELENLHLDYREATISHQDTIINAGSYAPNQFSHEVPAVDSAP